MLRLRTLAEAARSICTSGPGNSDEVALSDCRDRCPGGFGLSVKRRENGFRAASLVASVFATLLVAAVGYEWVERQRDAVDMRLWSFLGLGPGARVATVWGSPMDQGKAKGWRQRAGRILENLRFFSAYRLGETEIDRILDWLAHRRPDILMGYSSVLDLLAQRSLRRGGVPVAKFVVSSAEVLFPDQRERIERGLGAEVFNVYGVKIFKR